MTSAAHTNDHSPTIPTSPKQGSPPQDVLTAETIEQILRSAKAETGDSPFAGIYDMRFLFGKQPPPTRIAVAAGTAIEDVPGLEESRQRAGAMPPSKEHTVLEGSVRISRPASSPVDPAADVPVDIAMASEAVPAIELGGWERPADDANYHNPDGSTLHETHPFGPSPETQAASKEVEPQVPGITAAEEAVSLYREVIRRLQDEEDLLLPEARWETVCTTLEKLEKDILIEPGHVAVAACGLQEAAPEEYAQWIMTHAHYGIEFIHTMRACPGRLVTNYLSLYRPHLIAELKLDSLNEISILDAGLAALADYHHAMLEIKINREFAEGARNRKAAAADARVTAAAQVPLKLYLSTMEKLRQRRQTPMLNITTGGSVAVQFNTGNPPSAQPAMGH